MEKSLKYSQIYFTFNPFGCTGRSLSLECWSWTRMSLVQTDRGPLLHVVPRLLVLSSLCQSTKKHRNKIQDDVICLLALQNIYSLWYLVNWHENCWVWKIEILAWRSNVALLICFSCHSSTQASRVIHRTTATSGLTGTTWEGTPAEGQKLVTMLPKCHQRLSKMTVDVSL